MSLPSLGSAGSLGMGHWGDIHDRLAPEDEKRSAELTELCKETTPAQDTWRAEASRRKQAKRIRTPGQTHCSEGCGRLLANHNRSGVCTRCTWRGARR